MDIKELVDKIRSKKFKNLDEELIISKINLFLKREPKIALKLNSMNEKSSEFKKIVKFVKQEMHRNYGAFQADVNKRDKLLEELKNKINKSNEEEILELHKKILSTHKSTKERLEIYDELYTDLFSMTGTPDIIFDIGCGLNPFSLPWIDESIMYIASEFNNEDTKFIEKYFSIMRKRRKGILETVTIDLSKDYSKIKEIPSDVVFAWKLFDILDTKVTENIVKNINAKYLIASFSSKTLGNRRMNYPRRGGFQKMLRRLNLEYETKEYENEIFYIIKIK